MDLYYDPVVDEHVSSPMGLIAPVWYLAPQRREIAESAWTMAECSKVTFMITQSLECMNRQT